MLRYLTALLLPAALLLLTPADAEAQARRRVPPPIRPQNMTLAGVYENVSSGGTAYIYGRRRGYLFINEHGSEALFEYTAPGRLEMVEGEWAPTTATVQRDRRGQVRIRFDSTGRPGYWVRVSD